MLVCSVVLRCGTHTQCGTSMWHKYTVLQRVAMIHQQHLTSAVAICHPSLLNDNEQIFKSFYKINISSERRIWIFENLNSLTFTGIHTYLINWHSFAFILISRGIKKCPYQPTRKCPKNVFPRFSSKCNIDIQGEKQGVSITSNTNPSLSHTYQWSNSEVLLKLTLGEPFELWSAWAYSISECQCLILTLSVSVCLSVKVS